MSKSPVTNAVADGYDRSIWSTPEKPHPTRSDLQAFEDECRARSATPAAA